MDAREKDDVEQVAKMLTAHLRTAHAVDNADLAGASHDRLEELHTAEHEEGVEPAGHDDNPYATGGDVAEGNPYASGPDHDHRHDQASP